MTFRSVLCHVPAAAERTVHLRTAIGLADAFQATVIGIGAAAVPPFALRSGGVYRAIDDQWLSILREQMSAALSEAREHFQATIGERSAIWRSEWLEPTRALAEAARAADLIVASHPTSDRPDTSSEVDVGHLVLKAGRPVLICPPNLEHLGAGPVLVAWKDSREARRAIADALPLLKRSSDVLIVEASQDLDTAAAAARIDDVAAGLGRHGVTARTAVLTQDGPASTAILERAGDLDADLIVAGGYGHTRFGEWAFGGVTSDLLKQDRYFVLLSH